MLSTKVFVNFKIFKYWIEEEKTYLLLSVKKQFSGAKFDPKAYKNPNFHPKKLVE